MATEQKELTVIEESNAETIQKVYEKYIEEYGRKPKNPQLFTGFAKQFHDVHIPYHTAKTYLKEKSKKLWLKPNLAKSKLSSVSTPNVLTYSNLSKKNKLKSSLNEKYQTLSDLHLLKEIRNVIMDMPCIKDTEIAQQLNDTLWCNPDSQYFELCKRLSRSLTRNGLRNGNINNMTATAKDETFRQLYEITERVDIDEDEHDSAVFLLKTYYANLNKDSEYSYDYEKEEALSLYDSMVLKYRKTMHSVAIPNAENLKTQKSAPPIRSNAPTGVSKRLSLQLNEALKPDFLLENEAPVLDKGFRALSTFSCSTMDSVDTETMDMFDEHTTPESTTEQRSISPFTDQTLLDTMGKYDKQIDSWDFDVFSFMDDPSFAGKGLVYFSFYLFRRVGLLESTGVSQAHLWRFFERVEQGYLRNPYHNKYHAVDVLLNTHFFFQTEFMRSHMTQWDRFGAYIAAVCHDLGHMGFNNGYYVNTSGNLALLYDDSVLEMYHISETFRLLDAPTSNWMISFTSSIRKYLAMIIRDCILATDVKYHGSKIQQLQNMIQVFKAEVGNDCDFNGIKLHKCQSIANYASIEAIQKNGFDLFISKEHTRFDGDIIVNDIIDDENETKNEQTSAMTSPRIDGVLDERLFILGVTIHTCDVANPVKPLPYAIQWANNYIEEAYAQGDAERRLGIPVSPGMDRSTTKLANSQIGFIQYIVKRLFELYSQLIQSTHTEKCLQILHENEQYWKNEKKKANAYKIAKVPELGTIHEGTKDKKDKKTVKFKD